MSRAPGGDPALPVRSRRAGSRQVYFLRVSGFWVGAKGPLLWGLTGLAPALLWLQDGREKGMGVGSCELKKCWPKFSAHRSVHSCATRLAERRLVLKAPAKGRLNIKCIHIREV